MPEVKYSCPLCGVTLKAANRVPAGKKIKCPKCFGLFAPEGDEDEAQEEAPSKPPPQAKAKAKPGKKEEDEEETYKFVEDSEEEDEASRKKREEAISPIKDRLPKSARGPCLAICQKPSGQMLFTSSLTCASCIASIMVEIWPMVFTKVGLSALDIAEHFTLIGFAVAAFIWNGAIAVGAVKMQNVFSYTWAMIAAIMMVLPITGALMFPAFYWFFKLTNAVGFATAFYVVGFMLGSWSFYVGIVNIVTLRKSEVLAGFSEKPMVSA